ncbi:MAG: CoA pyrophosphatase [Mesorhizobium sp.]
MADDLRERVKRAAQAGASEVLGDHSLNPGTKSAIVKEGLRDAAVLIPIVDHPDGATMLLTKRTEKLRTHSGQIAFPGGGIDPEDASPEAAALRETEEEIGLDRNYIDVIGRMPDYYSGSGYRVAPIIGIVRPGFALSINPDEVDDTFEVPLSFLMNAANHRRESRVWQNVERHFYTMPYGDRYIWGLTAGIIRTVHDRFYA